MLFRVSVIVSQLFQVITFAKCVTSIMALNWYQRFKDKTTVGENLWSSAHVVHTTAKQVICRLRMDENGYEMYRKENSRAKRAKLLFFIVKYSNL